jgi:hypothetical protein
MLTLGYIQHQWDFDLSFPKHTLFLGEPGPFLKVPLLKSGKTLPGGAHPARYARHPLPKGEGGAFRSEKPWLLFVREYEVKSDGSDQKQEAQRKRKGQGICNDESG